VPQGRRPFFLPARQAEVCCLLLLTVVLPIECCKMFGLKASRQKTSCEMVRTAAQPSIKLRAVQQSPGLKFRKRSDLPPAGGCAEGMHSNNADRVFFRPFRIICNKLASATVYRSAKADPRGSGKMPLTAHTTSIATEREGSIPLPGRPGDLGLSLILLPARGRNSQGKGRPVPADLGRRSLRDGRGSSVIAAVCPGVFEK